ncbi:MAG: hypothetical protein ACK5G9_06515 [Akkermansiaceae bacterium]|jgi:hypothetical protein
MRSSSNIISICLIGFGVLAWTLTTRSLVENPDFDTPPNPFGIKRSPYGEVFAMAMQTPIDSYFHAAMGEEGHNHGPGEQSTDACTAPKEKHVHDENCKHDHTSDSEDKHIDDQNSKHDHVATTKESMDAEAQEATSLNARLLTMIGSMDEARHLRTNPKPANEGMKFHHRRETENKLRFAYEMDPSHYGNYNSLHFFLTEPQFGTRPQLTPTAAKLANETVNYCLSEKHDPRPALTAAAACANVLHLLFMDHNYNKSSTVTAAQMREILNLYDYCLARYDIIAKQWDESKNWELLSPMRIAECEARYRFVSKIREAAAKTVLRIENEGGASK